MAIVWQIANASKNASMTVNLQVKLCLFLLSLVKGTYKSCFPGCSSRRRGRDLHQTQPEDRWIYPASRLWMGHGWVRRPCLWIPDGPDQLPAFHFPGLHTPSGESDPPSNLWPVEPAAFLLEPWDIVFLVFLLILAAVKWCMALFVVFLLIIGIWLFLFSVFFPFSKLPTVSCCFAICSSHPY